MKITNEPTEREYEMLGFDVRYELNAAGDYESVYFADELIIGQSGDIGYHRSAEWQSSKFLTGAAKTSAQNKIIEDHVTQLIAMHILATADSNNED